jgi:hypothetical protein
MSNDDVRFRDFSKKRRPVYFMLNGPTPEGERFDCYPALALPSLQEIALISGNMTAENATESFVEFFKVVLQPESAERIEAKLNDRLYPLEIEQANEIMTWLMEVYGLRPSQPSSDSSAGSPTDDAGTPSGAGA